MSKQAVVATGKPRASMGIVVRTAEGVAYNLGTVHSGRIRGPLSRLMRRARVARYKRARLRTLEGTQREEFLAQIKALKEGR